MYAPYSSVTFSLHCFLQTQQRLTDQYASGALNSGEFVRVSYENQERYSVIFSLYSSLYNVID